MSDNRTDAVAWNTNVVKGFSRLDGYMNVVNRIGTSKDSSEAYEFAPETQVPDLDLAAHYEGNGLFAKIIDAPAEKAATRDFDLGVSDENVMSLVTDSLEDLGWITNVAQAVKWSRLFGGAIIVMLIDDGGRLEDPVNWDAIQGIDELVLFERAVVEPDYYSMYNYGQRYGLDRARTKYGQPEFFHVHSQYGSFTVHESRCLVFRNGTLPETTTQAEYRYWGLPEYIRIRRTLRETVTNHSIGTKMLEKSVQGVYKMKDLTEKLALEGGEDAVYKRMEVIDMVRGFLNSIIIDMDGEDYSFQTFQVSGFKEVIEASCNILSAVTNIPQVILFGQKVTGMGSGDDTSMESWYNYLGQINDLQVKPNLQRLLDILFRGWLNTGKLSEEPMYKLDFKPFWNLSESEQADLDLKKLQVQQAKAQVAQMYIDMQALDPQEVRRGLAKSEEFNIEELLDDEDIDDDAMSELEAALADLRPLNALPEQGSFSKYPGGFSSKTIPGSSAKEDRVDGRVDDDWVTIKGTHVLVGEGGEVTGGPSNLKGKKYPLAKSQKRSSNKPSNKGTSSGPSSSSDEPKSSAVSQYKYRYNDMENMALSSEGMAASFLMTVCGVPFADAKGYIDSGTAIEEAKKAIENKYAEIGKRFEKCPESQRKFMNMTPEEATAFASESYSKEIDSSLNRGSHTQHMVQALGLNDKPKIVNREEFDKIAAKSPTGPVFRGVVDNLAAGVTADEIVDMTINGELTYLGNGVHSDGIYFSTKKSTADGYASGGQGRMMEACFSDDARIVDYNVLLSQKSISKISDAGTFALYSGYNAIRVKQSDDEEYLIALDRSALVFCDSRGDSTMEGLGTVNGDELAKTFNAFVEQSNEDSYEEQESVGVIVVNGGEVLCGVRNSNRGSGMICGPGGHVEAGETPEQAAVRETMEEFGIKPKDLIPLGQGPLEPDTGLAPELFLCTEYEGEPRCVDHELRLSVFLPIEDLLSGEKGPLFPPFANSLRLLLKRLTPGKSSDTISSTPTSTDGGSGSGNFGHEGRKGQVGGSGGSLSAKEKGKIVKRLVGQSTHDGVVIQSVSAHAFDRIGGRRISIGRMERMRTEGKTSPGHTPDTRCYDIEGSRMVLNIETGNVVSIMWRTGGKK